MHSHPLVVNVALHVCQCIAAIVIVWVTHWPGDGIFAGIFTPVVLWYCSFWKNHESYDSSEV